MSCVHDNTIIFLAGEERFVCAKLEPKDPNETVVITSAVWSLFDRCNGETVESGDCEVEGREMRVLIGSECTGLFTLEVTAKVGRETVKQRCNVQFR